MLLCALLSNPSSAQPAPNLHKHSLTHPIHREQRVCPAALRSHPFVKQTAEPNVCQAERNQQSDAQPEVGCCAGLDAVPDDSEQLPHSQEAQHDVVLWGVGGLRAGATTADVASASSASCGCLKQLSAAQDFTRSDAVGVGVGLLNGTLASVSFAGTATQQRSLVCGL